MRILILNWKHPDDKTAGGAERYVVRVAGLWAGAGHEVTLLVPRTASAPLTAATSAPPGVRLLVQGTRGTIFKHARRYLAQHRHEVDAVLESISTRPFFAHELVGERALVLYHQIADDVWEQEYRFPVSWLGRRVVEPHWLRRIATARIAANSPSTAADLAGRGVHAVGIVPPGADHVPALPPRSLGNPPRLVFAGRLVRTKRPQDAIRAFASVRSAFPGATLDIIGDGYMRQQLDRQNSPGVTVHGFVSDQTKAETMARADLLLLPGTREGWGIVAIEAGLNRLPTVAYNVPGLRDAVVDGGTGVLTEPDPDALGAAAVDLLGDPLRWAAQAATARRRAATYTWQRAADGLMALMSGLALGQAGQSAA
jgi:glycosyltransferase involved in cell wall biosynthesis